MAEVCVGGGSFFLNLHPDSYRSALINDLDYPTYCLWRCLWHGGHIERFLGTLQTLPYSEDTFLRFHDWTGMADEVDWGLKHFIVNRMSRSGMGKTFAWSERLRGGKPGDLNAWETIVQQLPDMHHRLHERPLAITNRDCIAVIREVRENPRNFIYADPPYYPTSRKSKKVYRCEMSIADHRRLLASLVRAKCRVMLCGYHNELYDRVLSRWGWRCMERVRSNHSGQGAKKQKRIECTWLNYDLVTFRRNAR